MNREEAKQAKGAKKQGYANHNPFAPSAFFAASRLLNFRGRTPTPRRDRNLPHQTSAPQGLRVVATGGAQRN
ncbi:MAG: hypothetical protein WD009_08970, partial [Phycisphaeraceae bacterium]